MGLSSFKLFRLFGIDVFLHWSWFIMAAFIIPSMDVLDSYVWRTCLFIGLFGIVILHEFGHALACKSVGGQAKHIVLWPLGGVAFVNPPQRPGAVLWSIVAGPLVNVALVPVTVLAYLLVVGGFVMPSGDLEMFFFSLMLMNAGLLIFNMLPIYPLDGGQVLMSVLWYIIGRAKAMQVVGVIGLIGAGIGVIIAILAGDVILIFIAAFVAFQAWIGFKAGSQMAIGDPAQFDERLASRQQSDDVERKLKGELDPWR